MSETVFDVMLESYSISRQRYDPVHKSRHWQELLPDDYSETIRDESLWPAFRHNRIAFGMGVERWVDPAEYDPRVTRLYKDLINRVGVDFVDSLIDGEIGEPNHIVFGGYKLNYVDLTLIEFASTIKAVSDLNTDANVNIVDIGGGYGGLPAKLKVLFPKARVVSFELPETLAIETYYLSRLFDSASVLTLRDFVDADPGAFFERPFDFVALPGWEMDHLPDHWADIVINTRSMQEMNVPTIRYYFDQIHRTLRPGGLFHCVNRYVKGSGDETSVLKCYPFDDKWFFPISRPSWAEPHVHEIIGIRMAMASAFPTETALADYPPYTWTDCKAAARTLRTRMSTLLAGRDAAIQRSIAWGFVEQVKKPLRKVPFLFDILRRIKRGITR